MKKELGKIAKVTLFAAALYLFGVFNKFYWISLAVIIPLAIGFLIPLGRIIVMAFRKDKITDPE